MITVKIDPTLHSLEWHMAKNMTPGMFLADQVEDTGYTQTQKDTLYILRGNQVVTITNNKDTPGHLIVTNTLMFFNVRYVNNVSITVQS
jgi:hypothetical protein